MLSKTIAMHVLNMWKLRLTVPTTKTVSPVNVLVLLVIIQAFTDEHMGPKN